LNVLKLQEEAKATELQIVQTAAVAATVSGVLGSCIFVVDFPLIAMPSGLEDSIISYILTDNAHKYSITVEGMVYQGEKVEEG
jgi:hypothetical protein